MSRQSCTVEAGDGINLDARIFKPPFDSPAKGNLVIVLVHPYSVLGGCQALMTGIASELANQGLTAVTFDMRGVGRSTGNPSLSGFPEVNDVVSICKWVSRDLCVNRILVVGSSAAGTRITGIETLVF